MLLVDDIAGHVVGVGVSTIVRLAEDVLVRLTYPGRSYAVFASDSPLTLMMRPAASYHVNDCRLSSSDPSEGSILCRCVFQTRPELIVEGLREREAVRRLSRRVVARDDDASGRAEQSRRKAPVEIVHLVEGVRCARRRLQEQPTAVVVRVGGDAFVRRAVLDALRQRREQAVLLVRSAVVLTDLRLDHVVCPGRLAPGEARVVRSHPRLDLATQAVAHGA